MTEELQTMKGTAPIALGHTDETLVLLREQAKEVHLVAIDDEDSFKQVRDMRLLLRGARVAIENKRKEIKDESLRYGRAIDAEAKRLTAIIEPQEVRLLDEEQSVERMREQQRQEAERKRQEVINQRVREVAECGGVPNVDELAAMPQALYEHTITRMRSEKEQRDNEERMRREHAEADHKARLAQQKEIDDARAAELVRMREQAAALDRREREAQEREQRLHAAEAEAARKWGAEPKSEPHSVAEVDLLGIPAELTAPIPGTFTAHVNEQPMCEHCGQYIDANDIGLEKAAQFFLTNKTDSVCDEAGDWIAEKIRSFKTWPAAVKS